LFSALIISLLLLLVIVVIGIGLIDVLSGKEMVSFGAILVLLF
jgi:hypothetical protein